MGKGLIVIGRHGASAIPAATATDSGVAQSSNQAGGHIAARDVNVLEVKGDYIEAPPVNRPTALGRLYERLRDDANGDVVLSDYISQLEIFTRTVEDETVVGLDGKLVAAGRQDQLDMAKRMKEVVYSQLRQHMFSKTFQTIYATLMGKIFEAFQTWVRPAIVSGHSRAEIDIRVHNEIVMPLVAELEACSEYDGVAITEIRGMVYFLTGNCHLCWH